MSPLHSTADLMHSERRILDTLQRVRHGRIEHLRILHGEIVLDPWPTTIRGVKFGSGDEVTSRTRSNEFQLKRQVIELFEYVRSVDSGEIRCLECRHGLPFSMEIEHGPGGNGGRSV